MHVIISVQVAFTAQLAAIDVTSFYNSGLYLMPTHLYLPLHLLPLSPSISLLFSKPPILPPILPPSPSLSPPPPPPLFPSFPLPYSSPPLPCQALHDDITGYSGLPKAKVSLLLNMLALLLMAAMWYQVLLSNEVSAGGGGGGGHLSCSSAMFCTLRFCPFSPYGYSYRYHKPITHAACFCSYV